ncbi:MAG: flippase-like domain-containing protein [Bacteroidaceae bacterium]|nr:flippase-like domain-containing protein [Bacteroidaceae bacterium]
MEHILRNILKMFFPLLFGGGILWWMYRDTDWNDFLFTLQNEMHWGWMAISMVFGIVPQVFRALRWRMTLKPMGEDVSNRTCINAIFLSYAASLIVPRIGEVTRCGTLKKKEGISFTKAVGTVVSERIVDSTLMMLITAIALLSQLPTFMQFAQETGFDFNEILSRFTNKGYIVTFICVCLAIATCTGLILRYKMFSKGREHILNLWKGISSLRHVESPLLYWFYSVGIWVAYFLHFYLTFFCFEFTSSIDPLAALLIFSIGSFAVLVPTPNGAGSWHFAVKTMLVLYGVAENSAIIFALVVHTLQTMLVVVLGMWGSWDLTRTPARTRND